MAKFSRKGWIIRTALRKGRCFREVVDDGGGRVSRESRTELEIRAIIEKRMNYFEQVKPDDAEHAEDNESLWRFKERGQCGFVGSSVEFLATGMSEIRRLRATEAEDRRVARIAAAERREIKAATVRMAATPRPQRQAGGAGMRL